MDKNRLTKTTIQILITIILILGGGPIVTGYRFSPELFTGELRTLYNSQYGFSISYPGNWRIYEITRGNVYRILSLMDGFNNNGSIYIDYINLNEINASDALTWRREFYCTRVDKLCGSEVVWQQEDIPLEGNQLISTEFSYVTNQGVTRLYKEALAINGENVLFIGLSASGQDAFSRFEPYYIEILTSFHFTREE